MRIVGLDVGRRRIGTAISDPTATLASPNSVLVPADGLEKDGVALVVSWLNDLAQEEDYAVDAIVVGLPRRLDGSPTEMTMQVQAFATQLGARTGLPVTLQDERLTSVEAETRLAVREKDWKKRKATLDAAAAAIILQDYLDHRA